MFRTLLLSLLFSLALYAADDITTAPTQEDNNVTIVQKEVIDPISEEKLIVVEDNSGLSDDEIRQKAHKEEKKANSVPISKVTNAINEEGKIDLSKVQKSWEELSPTPKKYDWVKTKSGEWFKGKIMALYEDELEFDSDEIGIYTFDFNDVVEIKSYNIISVNIENLATFPGILRLKGDKLKVIQGENTYEFEKKDIISLAPGGEYERNLWSGKITIGIDVRKGNTRQYDYNAKVNIKRRTAKTRLTLDYLGRNSSKNDQQTADDHRINEKYDRYLSKNFFWTPVFSEFYTDKYKNIDRQISLGVGIGYTIIHTSKIEWNISAGPGYIYTRYVTVPTSKDIVVSSPAFEANTKADIELNTITDMKLDYKLTVSNRDSGLYKHHLILTFENDLNSWLDFDVSGIWDYLALPEADSNGVVPQRNDYQLLIGFGIEF